METQPLNALFTLESLASLQGAAAASYLVPNVIGYLAPSLDDSYRKWISFGVAMALAYLTAFMAPAQEWYKWVLAFFNGFLIFASAVGINEGTKPPRSFVAGAGKRFRASWF